MLWLSAAACCAELPGALPAAGAGGLGTKASAAEGFPNLAGNAATVRAQLRLGLLRLPLTLHSDACSSSADTTDAGQAGSAESRSVDGLASACALAAAPSGAAAAAALGLSAAAALEVSDHDAAAACSNADSDSGSGMAPGAPAAGSAVCAAGFAGSNLALGARWGAAGLPAGVSPPLLQPSHSCSPAVT